MLLTLLLLLVIIGAVIFLALQRYMVYDADGNLRLDLPGWGESGAASNENPVSSEDVNIIIDKKDPEPPAGGEGAAPDEPETVVRGALQLQDVPLTDWPAALERMQGADVGAVCLTVKDDQGVVYVDSAAAAAISRRLVAAKEATRKAVADLTADEAVHSAVARISCLQDSRAPILDVRALGLRQRSGYLFYDDAGASWLNPAGEAVLRYLSGLARDCAELGFDEILLTNVAYPVSGNVEQIRYGENSRGENLVALVQTVRAALEGYPVKLSLELPAEVILNGEDEISGQNLSRLAPLVDCIYARTTAAEAAQLAELVKAAAPDTGFVAEVTDAEGIATDWLLLETE